ncbi:MAG: autotransporter-associated beta strand repeat-containing protein [Pirellulales bacterium]
MRSSSTIHHLHQTELQLSHLFFGWRQALCSSVLVIVGGAAASSASAQDTVWTNLTLGNWFINGNWSSGVPVGNDDARIDNGGIAFINSPGAVGRNLDIGRPFVGGGLTISSGGTLTLNDSSHISTSGGATASATVSGNGSRWDVSDTISVGTNGTFRIENGADAQSFGGQADGTGGSSGSATVTGPGSTWTVTGADGLNSFIVGREGAGLLTVSSGGTVDVGSGYSRIGLFNGSTGSVNVTGANSLWNIDGPLFVGGTGTAANFENGAGTLQISSGGRVQAAHLQVFDTGSAQVNNGSSTVSGLTVSGGVAAPAVASPLGPLTVGNTASGRMVVQNGGTISNSLGTIGATSSTFGSVLVEGAGSTWTNTDQVSVGHGGGGTGTLEVRGGGTLSSVRGFAGAGAFSTGLITVSDPGSTWTASGSFFIGNSGSGLLEVLNGGVASTAGNSHLGITVGATGDVNVSGAGSTWNTAVLLNIGGDSNVAQGAGSVRIADGGTVNVGSATNLYSTGTLDLVNATTFTGDINAFGGLIRTSGDTTLANAVHLNEASVSVETNNQNGSAVFSGNIDGPGGLTKRTIFGITGKGTLALTAANTYTGPTTINAGTLLVDGSITSATTVNAGATLGGSGTIAANVTNNGIVAPGNSPGTLHITGNYTQNAGGTLKIEIESPDGFDRLAVTGNMALGGTLEISLIDGFMPTADQSFDILSWGSLAGAFSSVIVPTQEGVVWDTSQLSTGVISVAVTGLPGDYNQDGIVNAADYTVWRDTGGTQTGYETWRANFGATLGTGSGATAGLSSSADAAVPEPAPLVLLALGGLFAAFVFLQRNEPRLAVHRTRAALVV